MLIRKAAIEDAPAIAEIYNWYIANTTVTFAVDPVTVIEVADHIRETLQEYDWIVAEVDNSIAGYANYGQFRKRAAYHHTVEGSIYVSQAHIGKGIGTTLFEGLLRSARGRGFREMIGVVALPNPASIALQRKLGFVEIGVLKNVGCKFEKYIDVSIWQKSLCE